MQFTIVIQFKNFVSFSHAFAALTFPKYTKVGSRALTVCSLWKMFCCKLRLWFWLMIKASTSMECWWKLFFFLLFFVVFFSISSLFVCVLFTLWLLLCTTLTTNYHNFRNIFLFYFFISFCNFIVNISSLNWGMVAIVWINCEAKLNLKLNKRWQRVSINTFATFFFCLK